MLTLNSSFTSLLPRCCSYFELLFQISLFIRVTLSFTRTCSEASMSSNTSLYLDQEDLTRRLLDLTSKTGYEILQKHGQRIYGGPPPGWTGPQPDKGTEVYCYRIPRDCFEDELVPVFSSVGKIYELRLMIEFSGSASPKPVLAVPPVFRGSGDNQH